MYKKFLRTLLISTCFMGAVVTLSTLAPVVASEPVVDPSFPDASLVRMSIGGIGGGEAKNFAVPTELDGQTLTLKWGEVIDSLTISGTSEAGYLRYGGGGGAHTASGTLLNDPWGGVIYIKELHTRVFGSGEGDMVLNYFDATIPSKSTFETSRRVTPTGGTELTAGEEVAYPEDVMGPIAVLTFSPPGFPVVLTGMRSGIYVDAMGFSPVGWYLSSAEGGPSPATWASGVYFGGLGGSQQYFPKGGLAGKTVTFKWGSTVDSISVTELGKYGGDGGGPTASFTLQDDKLGGVLFLNQIHAAPFGAGTGEMVVRYFEATIPNKEAFEKDGTLTLSGGSLFKAGIPAGQTGTAPASILSFTPPVPVILSGLNSGIYVDGISFNFVNEGSLLSYFQNALATPRK